MNKSTIAGHPFPAAGYLLRRQSPGREVTRSATLRPFERSCQTGQPAVPASSAADDPTIRRAESPQVPGRIRELQGPAPRHCATPWLASVSGD